MCCLLSYVRESCVGTWNAKLIMNKQHSLIIENNGVSACDLEGGCASPENVNVENTLLMTGAWLVWGGLRIVTNLPLNVLSFLKNINVKYALNLRTLMISFILNN